MTPWWNVAYSEMDMRSEAISSLTMSLDAGGDEATRASVTELLAESTFNAGLPAEAQESQQRPATPVKAPAAAVQISGAF